MKGVPWEYMWRGIKEVDDGIENGYHATVLVDMLEYTLS